MKKSSMMHIVSIVTGIWGALALVGAWLAGDGGTIFEFSQQHYIYDAIILELISISAGVCAIYRKALERDLKI